MTFENSRHWAKKMDAADSLRPYRRMFHFPKHNGKNALYFCGNSLGLQPKTVRKALLSELDQWKTYAVEGHFQGDMPWMPFHKFLTPQTARLVGAQPQEVVVMNTLTTNLHLMMISFYRPDKQRFKIIMEGGAFPSDQYAVESQVRLHGLDPDVAIVEIHPKPGADSLQTADILEVIEREGPHTALVLFGGVNYYTGQFYDLEAIAAAGHKAGARVGFDLAHAAGNLPLKLHDWGPDFAVWCSYKYLNSGPGGPSGVFVHARHADNPDLPRLAGWWGHDEQERFKMRKGFHPMKGAEGWQLSNAQIFSLAAHKASLDIFDAVGMDALRQKSIQLTGYLAYLLEKLFAKKPGYKIITPKDPAQRGTQLSILTDNQGKKLFDYLSDNGAICDWREPNVIRLAPVPLYVSFEDVWQLGQLIEKGL